MVDMSYSAGDMIFNKKLQFVYAFCKIVGCFSGKPMLGERGWGWKSNSGAWL